jgi:L-alanine-DL-glutamate epimerase-like enolase superfamily enzyme
MERRAELDILVPSMSDSTTPARARIAAIETVLLRLPLPRPFKRKRSEWTHRPVLVTRVISEGGLVGEAYVVHEDAELVEAEDIVREEIAPPLVGEDALRIEGVWELARPATSDVVRSRHLGLLACGVVDTAVWDLVGKALGQPLWRLWGGYGNQVPVVSTGTGLYGPDANLAADVERSRELGLGGMKLKVGGLTPDEDAVRVRSAREAAGPGFLLAVDANQAWSPQEAIRFARLVEDCDLLWFEEPCRWHNDRRAMRDVRLGGGTRVCAGQGEQSASGCIDLMVDGAIDICNFDSVWSGGPTEWRRVAAAALALDVKMGHHVAPQVASHLLASIPHGTCVECSPPHLDQSWWTLVANRPPLRDGRMELSDAPGLGWELDAEVVERYRVTP